ncbi:MAG: HAD-IC family P-type ATPase [Anaerolineales bacterium]|nr:HAD-IC family P-type ATPase [Anaerolineales bacterium]
MTNLWHVLSPQQTELELSTDPETGLSSAEAQARLANYGPNQLPEPAAVSPWQLFLSQFKSVMTILLLAAAIIAFFMGDELEAISITVVLLLNALLGFVNEYRAERSVQALKAMTVPFAKVVRDGETNEVPSVDLVPGDLITFEAGDRIPADARLAESWNLRLDESALTGESLAVDKDANAELAVEAPLAERLTMVYTGSAVVEGRGQAIVTATGAATEMGRISGLLTSTKEEQTPLQYRLDKLGRYLALAALGIAALVAVAGLIRGKEIFRMLETSLALAIAAVPEGLSAVVTIALALGMRRMAKRRAIVRRLAAVETLGSTNVICTDKTGTLTQNQMTVRELRLGDRSIQVSGAGYEPRGEFLIQHERLDPQADPHLLLALHAGLLCNNAALDEDGTGQWSVVGDPTEGALIVAAIKAGIDPQVEQEAYPRVDEVPFDSRERRMATIHQVESDQLKVPGLEVGRNFSSSNLHPAPSLVFAKGAPETILPGCARQQDGAEIVDLSAADRERFWNINTEMAAQALRVLALAYKVIHDESRAPFDDLIFLGFAGMIDPPRPEAKEAVSLCQDAGIRTVMITGDQKTTAQAIAAEMGILPTGSNAADGVILDGPALDKIDETALRELISRTAVYARVSPEHKLRIVHAFQDRNQIVAMTGDGVNDAPALKAADIGVAMGRMGTDVAREAADMVLADDNFATIVAAVEEGRVVFANVRKFVHYLFSCNLSEILTVFVATVSGLPMPLLPLQILWLNLVTDVFPALALAGEPAEPGIMKRPPPEGARYQRPPASFVRSVVSQGSLLALSTLAAFVWALRSSPNVERATTVAFLTLGLAQLFHAFNSRYESGPVFRAGLFSNRSLWAAIGLTLALEMAAIYLPGAQAILKTVPLTPYEWIVVVVASLSPALVIEIYKLVVSKNRG